MLILTFVLVLLMGAFYFLSYPDFFGINIMSFRFFKNSNSQSTQEEVLSVQQDSVFEEISGPVYSFPKKIVIDSLGIDIEIVSVGVDEEGHLEAPKNWNEAGWYKKGAKPSEPGNLLINAHYDDTSGRPAAFWKLKNINVGDKVSVLDSYGRTFDYRVSDVSYVDINDPNRSEVFEDGEEGKPILTLITCGGVWSVSEGTYSKRLVVTAELISE